jgi:hypothetical protein
MSSGEIVLRDNKGARFRLARPISGLGYVWFWHSAATPILAR